LKPDTSSLKKRCWGGKTVTKLIHLKWVIVALS